MGIRNYSGVTNDLDVATKRYVDDGLGGKASVADATLNGGGSSPVKTNSWTWTPSDATYMGSPFRRVFWDEDCWVAETIDSSFLTLTGDIEAELVQVMADDEEGLSDDVEFERDYSSSGYRLGPALASNPNYFKLLASEDEAETLRVAVAGKAAASHTHTKSQISDFPALATVATSGSYNDLTDKPTIPTVGTLDTTASTAQSTNASESLSGSVTLHKVSKTGSYNDLSNKPEFSTGLTESQGTVSVTRPVPASTSTDEGKVLGIVDSNDTLGWVVPAVQQELRYAIVTPTATTSTTDSADDTISATLQDRAVNIVTAGSGIDYVNLTFPASEQGYARDFFVRLVLTGDSVPAVSFSEPGGGDVGFDVDDDSWAEIELGVNLLMFTETSQSSDSNS